MIMCATMCGPGDKVQPLDKRQWPYSGYKTVHSLDPATGDLCFGRWFYRSKKRPYFKIRHRLSRFQMVDVK